MDKETKNEDTLPPEAGGAIVVNDELGNDVTVEMAVSPFAVNTIPNVHNNGNEPLEY